MTECGVDEAGRGPWAGPVVAAAVVFRGPPPDGLRDSKKLSARKREALYEVLLRSHAVGVGFASELEIDAHNILQATFLAMRRAVSALPALPDTIWVDGNQRPEFPGIEPAAVCTLVKGDDLMPVISAASIVAKVTRDRYMAALDRQYPGYGFARHSGYGVPAHIAALDALGPCPAHRKSFAPIARRLSR